MDTWDEQTRQPLWLKASSRNGLLTAFYTYLQVFGLNFLPCRMHDSWLSLHWHRQVSGFRGWCPGHSAAHTQPQRSSSHLWPAGHDFPSPWPSHWHSPERRSPRKPKREWFYESKWNFIIYCVTHAWQHCRAKYLMVVFLLVRHLHESIFPKLPCICVFLSLELAHLLSEWGLHGAFIVNCSQWIQRLEENLILKSCTLTFCTTQPKHI